VDFNTQLTLNRKLREEIDHLRNERALYGGLYKRLSRELQEAKEELTDTIEISTQAFEQRCTLHTRCIDMIVVQSMSLRRHMQDVS